MTRKHRLRFWLLSAVFTAAGLLAGRVAHAKPQHNVHAGAGWQNTGASRNLTWEPGIQGSRKEVPVFVGWSLVGDGRVYYAPYARVQYMNSWSMGGAMNLLGVDLGLGGLGIYLTQPPRWRTPEQNHGRWFATLEINFANLRFGTNVTPNGPKNPRVPDPDARRETIRDYQRMDRADELDSSLQHYPFGRYSYVAIGMPIQLRVWKMVRKDLGVGGFFETSMVGFEWPTDRTVNRPGLVYNVVAGFSLTFGPAGRR